MRRNDARGPTRYFAWLQFAACPQVLRQPGRMLVTRCLVSHSCRATGLVSNYWACKNAPDFALSTYPATHTPSVAAELMQPRYISMHDRCRSTRTSIRVQARNMIELSEHQIIDQIADRLAGIHPEVSPEAVTRVVQEEHARFNGRPVRDFVPLFVERYAKAELA